MTLLLLHRHCRLNVLFLKIQPRQSLGFLTPRGGPAPYFELAVRKWTTCDPTVTTLLSNNRDHEKTNITEETLRAIHKKPMAWYCLNRRCWSKSEVKKKDIRLSRKIYCSIFSVRLIPPVPHYTVDLKAVFCSKILKDFPILEYAIILICMPIALFFYFLLLIIHQI